MPTPEDTRFIELMGRLDDLKKSPAAVELMHFLLDNREIPDLAATTHEQALSIIKENERATKQANSLKEATEKARTTYKEVYMKICTLSEIYKKGNDSRNPLPIDDALASKIINEIGTISDDCARLTLPEGINESIWLKPSEEIGCRLIKVEISRYADAKKIFSINFIKI